MNPTVSIVVPVYNEQAVLPALFQELSRVCRDILGEYGVIEVVLVNDGSRDQSWDQIAAQCRKDPTYVGVNLSRNFGHQFALSAGLETARGDIIVSMDADLQDPPEVIAQLIEAHYQGYDVVYATRQERGREGLGKRASAKVFYWLIEKISGVPLPRNTGDFRLLSRRAITELARLQETHRFLRGLVPWVGFPQTQVFFDRRDRAAGSTHYSWAKMLQLGFDGITSMSTAPLRLAYVLSLTLFLTFVGYVVYVLYGHFILGHALVPGWTSIISAISIFGTIQLFQFGVLGEYVGRIYEQVKQRPPFIIQEIIQAKAPGRPDAKRSPLNEKLQHEMQP